MKKIEFTNKQIKDIVSKYIDDKLCMVKIAKIYNVCREKIRHILIKNKVKIRGQQRDFFNEDYFEKIDTETKAYFLGYLLADGCIGDKHNCKPTAKWQNSVGLNLQNRDWKVLELLKKELNSSKKIVFHKNRDTCKISFTSNKLCDDLGKLGVLPRKSLTAEFPDINLIPKDLMRHFIRGLFDGDGCITSTHPSHKTNPSFSFDICGSYGVCSGLQKILSKIVVKEDSLKLPGQQGKIYRLYYKKFQSLKNLYNYLYENSNIYLDRKRNKFKEIFLVKRIKFKSYDIID